ncbi:uncharacterized protein LOC124111648 isoform X1 [Haliotis rufescens]|uniref:uncharacterized protein LOC124111648 isoform X1 n=1 Tax=Haliotis rufescens TaxID=6454 RepID=UPI00201E7D36|nr:uncharacterized protein LOC124111648 isoform X1 [Haliotis rufescens]
MESLVLLVFVLGAVGADVNSNLPGADTFGGVTNDRLDYIAKDTFPSLESVPVLNTIGRHAVESDFLDYRVDEIIAFLGLYDDHRFERVMTSRVCVEYLQDMGAEYRKTLISLDLPVKSGVTALEPNDLKENQKILDVLRGLAPEGRITLIKAFDTKRLANVLVAGGAKVYEDHLFQGIIKGLITVFGANDFEE